MTLSSINRRISSYAHRCFAIDLRSLALYRVVLGSLVIFDLVLRSFCFAEHYTDAGMVPREAMKSGFLKSWFFSINLISGDYWVQLLLFLITGFCGLALLVGYRTRLFTFLTWLFVVSIQIRNPVILTGGDTLFRLLLFWGMFLPLGARFSVDEAFSSNSRPLPKSIMSFASAALMLQVCFVYVFSAIFKSKKVWWDDATALYYTLNIDFFGTGVGRFLLEYVPLEGLAMMSRATYIIELVVPFFAFISLRPELMRIALVAFFWLLHLSFALVLKIGIFPFVCVCGWIVFLPGLFWDKLAERVRTSERTGIVIFYDGDCGFCKKMVLLLRSFLALPDLQLRVAQSDPAIAAAMSSERSWVVVAPDGTQRYRFGALAHLVSSSPIFWVFSPFFSLPGVSSLGNMTYRFVASRRSGAASFLPNYRSHSFYGTSLVINLCGAAALGLIYFWNLSGVAPEEIKLSSSLRWTGKVLRVNQKWNMFSPGPLRDDGWFVWLATKQNGELVDLFNEGKPIDWRKPEPVTRQFETYRVRKIITRLRRKNYRKYRRHVANYYCRSWNDTHQEAERVTDIKMYFMKERTMPPGTPVKLKKILLHKQNC